MGAFDDVGRFNESLESLDVSLAILIQLFEQLDLSKGSKHTEIVYLSPIDVGRLSLRDLHIYGVANYCNYPHKR